VRRDELAAVPLEDQLVGKARPQRLADEDEIGNPTDQLFDGRNVCIEACLRRGPQRGAHDLSVIGPSQELVKRSKSFSKLSLS
jgi:hypothetical protein